jgi:hypothetical protein
MSLELKIFLYFLMSAQMLAWAWFSFKGGNLNNQRFYLFSALMACGQIGAAVETIFLSAWGTAAVQIYFLIFTIFGWYRRYLQAQKKG